MNTCLDSSLAVAQSLLLQNLEGYQSLQYPINNDKNKQYKE
jgi:hypothetical protein